MARKTTDCVIHIVDFVSFEGKNENSVPGMFLLRHPLCL